MRVGNASSGGLIGCDGVMEERRAEFWILKGEQRMSSSSVFG